MKWPLLVIILCGACSQQNAVDVGAFNNIDPTFMPFYNAFSATYGVTVNTPIAFVPQTGVVVGKCTTYYDGHRQIEIDPVFWNTIPLNQQTVLIFHELGHCVLNRLHNWNRMADGCPASIMQISNFGDPCYMLHKAEYISELPNAEPGDHL